MVVASDTPEVPSAPRTVVVADPDAGRLAQNTSALRGAGYNVHAAGDAANLAGLLAEGEPAAIIADAALLPGLETEVPVLVMVDLDDPWQTSLRPSGMHDCITKPTSPRELVHRTTALIDQVARRRASRQDAEALREQLRLVSAAVRATNDPQEIARYVVEGFGRTFKADHVRLETFEDNRVPRITAAWDSDGLEPLSDDDLPDEDSARRTADQLWAGAETLSTDAGDADDAEPSREHADGGQAADGDAPASGIANAASTLAVPMGEGSSSLGIIWIASLDKPRKWSRAELGLIQHVAGNAAHGLIQSHLISSQQQVVKQLQQLDKAKTDFLATVNHELRTPLTSIMAYLDMIQESTEQPGSAEIHQMLDIVVRNTERLRTLIEDMLSVSRNGLDDTLMHLTPVRLGHTLDLVASALRPLAKLQNVTIALDPVPDDPEILADEIQLQQVFTNLVSNAIKFTPSGGRIEVGSESHAAADGSRWATVRVADNGIGISSDEIDHVFTRFYRASNAMSGAIPGTGLGLAITKDIVARHGGTIDVASTLGAGTTVTVSLPLDADRSQSN
ncbi:multi-sensor signal transduction histidine kinase [Pseudarthrobacter chlorophenolicus A6]|uniref:histidine kinase n=1 Tax=Pseudarthrobacter chlorophenolicus (strain ATCC 700700 / DSM 12829 / CIP 107037 / JCM 12360 / KCTC 9906 / NCIMB 13794 / A6) TaxID=452863 RepID=B8H976_PSECP|nr:multi-sensor signal transduction histidine kinase [Pseudarthrobacter chlorophenolicus A6]SDQ52795.1 Signal transduction histidine kinase [Pseudarthrobacter chlorophenolicus]